MLTTLALLALTVPPEGVPNPRSSGGWVVDLPNVIPADAEARMNMAIERLERDTRAEIAVVVVQETDRVPKEFATALFQRWGLGKADADNGLLVLLVMGQRRLEMETGYGLEPVLGDGWLGAMQAEVMVPAFKAGDYAKGLEAGLGRVDAELRAYASDVKSGTRRSGSRPGSALRSSRGGPDALSVLMGASMFLLPIGFAFAFARMRKRERTCTRCGVEMHLLDEKADDAHLTEGQQKEERLGSVDYLVYQCDPCEKMKIVARNKWFSGQSRCTRCKFKTMQTRTVTLSSATYSSGGLEQITQTCSHCHYKNTYTRSTPRLQRSSSSGSSYRSGGGGGGGGGSFGGGRSGGGGAGSSW